MSELIKLEIDGPIATMTFQRPDALNALGDPGDGDAMAAACAEINANHEIRCAILTGAGRAFSAGGNVKAMQTRTGSFAGSPAEVREAYRANIHRLMRALYGLEVPLIAAINGPAIGLGCHVACQADVRLCAADSKFGVTFLRLGLIPGDGGSWLLPKAVGFSRAAELMFTGDVIDAETASAWGLVSRVVAPDQLMAEARALALRIAAQPAQALRMTKMLLRQAKVSTYDQMLELSAAAQGLMHHTDDHAEGVAALLEKRPPNFTGR